MCCQSRWNNLKFVGKRAVKSKESEIQTAHLKLKFENLNKNDRLTKWLKCTYLFLEK